MNVSRDRLSGTSAPPPLTPFLHPTPSTRPPPRSQLLDARRNLDGFEVEKIRRRTTSDVTKRLSLAEAKWKKKKKEYMEKEYPTYSTSKSEVDVLPQDNNGNVVDVVVCRCLFIA